MIFHVPLSKITENILIAKEKSPLSPEGEYYTIFNHWQNAVY